MRFVFSLSGVRALYAIFPDRPGGKLVFRLVGVERVYMKMSAPSSRPPITLAPVEGFREISISSAKARATRKPAEGDHPVAREQAPILQERKWRQPALVSLLCCLALASGDHPERYRCGLEKGFAARSVVMGRLRGWSREPPFDG